MAKKGSISSRCMHTPATMIRAVGGAASIKLCSISNSGRRGFCAASERADLAEDPRFNTPGGRAVNATERILLMAEIIKQRPTADWLQRLDTNDVPSAPVLRRNEVIANEQVLARELIAEFDHPDIGRVRQPKPAARFDRTPAGIQGPAPRIGEHSATICRAPLEAARDRAAGGRDRALGVLLGPDARLRRQLGSVNAMPPPAP